MHLNGITPLELVMKTKVSFAVAACLVMFGCATPESMKPPAGPMAAVPICRSDAECAEKWARARTFVLQNAGMKIQTYSGDYIETYNSTDMTISAQVNKEPAPGSPGVYGIVAKFWCGNPFGCMVHPARLLDQFNREVAGSQ